MQLKRRERNSVNKSKELGRFAFAGDHLQIPHCPRTGRFRCILADNAMIALSSWEKLGCLACTDRGPSGLEIRTKRQLGPVTYLQATPRQCSVAYTAKNAKTTGV